MNTVITHFHNEEYLLPFWINHHKKIFDHGIMINYHSTDRSVEICRELCPPHWKIVNTVNDTFVALTNDLEVKYYENSLEGFKIALTVTEFLLIPASLNEINKYLINNKIDYLKTTGVGMIDMFPDDLPTSNLSLIKQKHHGVIRNYRHPDPSISYIPDIFNATCGRYYHNQPFGKYTSGRHRILSENVLHVADIFTLKYKFSPWNRNIIDRILYQEIKVRESIEFEMNSEQYYMSVYEHFLKCSHDLNDDYSFKVAFNYCNSL
jgi:hypothetical protein